MRCWAPCSQMFQCRFQPSAETAHSRRWAALYCVGSNDGVLKTVALVLSEDAPSVHDHRPGRASRAPARCTVMLCGLSPRRTCRRYCAGLSMPIFRIGESFAMSFMARGPRRSRLPGIVDRVSEHLGVVDHRACDAAICRFGKRVRAVIDHLGSISTREPVVSQCVDRVLAKQSPKESRVEPAAGAQKEKGDAPCVNRKKCRRRTVMRLQYHSSIEGRLSATGT